MKTGKTAVIMRTKNRPLLLKRAIESVVHQTDPDWVLSIVNDGGECEPVEKLVEACESETKSKIHITHHAESKGMEAASNAAISAVQSKFCVIHDDDDAWDPVFLAETTAALDECKIPSMKGVITETIKIIERIEGDEVIEESRENWPFDNVDMTLWNMCAGNLFPPIAFLYEREVYETVGMYDPKLPVLGDWHFNLRFMRHFDMLRLPKRLAHYRIRSGSPTPAYFSTVTHQSGAHHQYKILLHNSLLREDLDANRVDLGVLVNIAHAWHQSQQIAYSSHDMLTRFNQIKAKTAQVARRVPLLKSVVRRISG